MSDAVSLQHIETVSSQQLVRHSYVDRVVHWVNAFLWIFLAITGFALVDNPQLTVFGGAFSRFMADGFGGKAGLLQTHIFMGLAWAVIMTGTLVYNAASVCEFLRQIFRLQPGDGLWLLRKPFLMLLGTKLCARFGLPLALPPQGFYNIGQKGFGVLSLLASIVLVVTGIVLSLAAYTAAFVGTTLLLWSVAIHYLCAGITLAGLLVHIYMAAIAPGERPGLLSMFTGRVPLSYAQSHHGLWADERKNTL